MMVAMEKRQLNLYLDSDLINRTKHAAVDEEKRLSDFVANALEIYLAQNHPADEEEE
jgi:hypothetical protein